jgi:hypothetical protein
MPYIDRARRGSASFNSLAALLLLLACSDSEDSGSVLGPSGTGAGAPGSAGPGAAGSGASSAGTGGSSATGQAGQSAVPTAGTAGMAPALRSTRTTLPARGAASALETSAIATEIPADRMPHRG